MIEDYLVFISNLDIAMNYIIYTILAFLCLVGLYTSLDNLLINKFEDE